MNKYYKELKKARDKVRASRLASDTARALDSSSASYWASASYSAKYSASNSAWSSTWDSGREAKDKLKELNHQIDLVLKEL